MQELDDLGAQMSHVARCPGVVRAPERLATDVRERPLEELLAVDVAFRIRLRKQSLELVEVESDSVAVEDVPLSCPDDDIAELRTGLADSPVDPRPCVLNIDIRPKESNEFVRRRPLLVESQVSEELLRLGAEPAAARLCGCDPERAEQCNRG